MTDSDRKGTGVSNPGVYDASNIVVLEGLEPIRRRPGMYVGNVHDGSALHHLVLEMLDEAVEQHERGCCNVSLTIHDDGSLEIDRDGPGLPVRPCRDGRSQAELELTVLHGGGAFVGDTFKRSASLRGVGLCAVNALSERLELEIREGGVVYEQVYRQGKPEGPLEKTGETDEDDGQRIKIWPDPTIFRSTEFDITRIATRLDELAMLVPGMRFDLRVERERAFHSPSGLKAGVERLFPGEATVGTVLSVRETVGDVEVDLAIRFLGRDMGEVESFACGLKTAEGGAHVDGLLEAVEGAMRNERERAGRPLQKHQRAWPERGLVACVHVLLPWPEFEGQTREQLKSGEARLAVRLVAERLLKQGLEGSPELRERLAR